MAIKKIPAWETSDGQVFTNVQDANRHEVDIELVNTLIAIDIKEYDITDLKIWLKVKRPLIERWWKHHV